MNIADNKYVDSEREKTKGYELIKKKNKTNR
jgi:hypothetical protein